MAALVPIEDAGPRLAFRIVRLLRVFVTAASPGVVAGNPSETKSDPGLFQPVQANSGAGWNDGFKGRLRKKKGGPGKFFDWMELKPEPESERGSVGRKYSLLEREVPLTWYASWYYPYQACRPRKTSRFPDLYPTRIIRP